MSLAPIVLFVFNRPEHTKKTLNALSENLLADQSTLIIYADGPKGFSSIEEIQQIESVRLLIKEKQWCKNVIIKESLKNRGLAASIITGVTETMNEYGKAIILEDDIATSPFFLKYMNKSLNIYKDNKKVMHISGYLPETDFRFFLPETFFLRFMSCWGWASWKESWDMAIWDSQFLLNKINNKDDLFRYNYENSLSHHKQLEDNISGSLNTWAIKWYTSIYVKDGFCLYPKASLVQNIGFDGSGTNCFEDVVNRNITTISSRSIKVRKRKIRENFWGHLYLRNFYRYGNSISLFKFMLLTISFLIRRK